MPHPVRDDQPWERRRYWHDGEIVSMEWWQDNRPVPDGPPTPPLEVVLRDFCYRHGTPIYPTLGCQVCGQRPGQPGR